MKVKYIGKDRIGMKKGTVYNVLSIEHDWYRVYLSDYEEDYLFPPTAFEVVSDDDVEDLIEKGKNRITRNIMKAQ